MSIQPHAMEHTARNDTLSICTLVTLLWFLSLSPAHCAEFRPYKINGTADFTLPDIRGDTHTLEGFRGKVVLVNFWASWCPPCIYELPELQRLQQRIGDDDFTILAINAGEKKYAVRRFIKLIRLNLQVLLDSSSELFGEWNAKTLPTSYLLDKAGKIRYRVQGNPGWEDENTIDIIQQLRKELPAQTADENTSHQRP